SRTGGGVHTARPVGTEGSSSRSGAAHGFAGRWEATSTPLDPLEQRGLPHRVVSLTESRVGGGVHTARRVGIRRVFSQRSSSRGCLSSPRAPARVRISRGFGGTVDRYLLRLNPRQ